MNIKTFDSIGTNFTPAAEPTRAEALRADTAGFAASPAPAMAARSDAPFAQNAALYERMHKRGKGAPVALLVAGAAVVVTGAIVLATSGHRHSAIGQTPAPAAEPVEAGSR